MSAAEAEGLVYVCQEGGIDYDDRRGFLDYLTPQQTMFEQENLEDEDREAARAIQETVTTRANTHFTFGYYESAIVNFHRHLAEHIDR